MIGVSILLIALGILMFRFSPQVGETKKVMDEEWGLTATTSSGYALLSKVFGVVFVIAGEVVGISALFQR
jgi:hypothetical protein